MVKYFTEYDPKWTFPLFIFITANLDNTYLVCHIRKYRTEFIPGKEIYMKRFSILLFLILICFIASFIHAAAPPESQVNEPLSPEPSNLTAGTLMAVGDISFSGIDGLVLKNPEYPWMNVKSVLDSATVLMGNEECPLSNRGTIYTEKRWKLRANPRTVQSLAFAGFDVVTLSNNHLMDYGPIAMRDTIDTLDQANIGHAGAGENLAGARQPFIFTTPEGVKFAFLAYSLVYPEIFWANSTRPGTPYGDPAFFVPDIKKAKTMADFVIVSFHWSDELHFYPSDYQKVYGKKCIDAGASIVIGHHPHVLQGLEVYKGGLIAYSLGNFVFGSNSKNIKDSIILSMEYDKNGFTKAKLYPVNVYNPEVNFQPRLRHGADAERVLQDLRTFSKEFRTAIESQGDVGVIKIHP